MRRTPFLAMVLLALGTNTARAQLFSIPLTPLPYRVSGTDVDAFFGRQLNDYQQNALGVTVARAGIGGELSVRVGAGILELNSNSRLSPDREWMFSGALQTRLTKATSPTAFVLFAGMGYMHVGGDRLPAYTATRFPIGMGLAHTYPTASGGTIGLSVMPRFEIQHIPRELTWSDYGVSASMTMGLPGGLGFGMAIDVLRRPTVWVFGANVQYSIP